MIKVACISCQHPYDLDERRLPSTGLKMRCPKCGTTFLVFPDGRTDAAPQKNTILGGMAAPPSPVKPPGKPLVPAPAPPSAADDLGLDLPAPKGAAPSPKDSLDLPRPVLAPKPPALDLDLPAPKGAKPALDDLDLPAPRGAVPKPPAAPASDDLDLPAPRGAMPKPPPPKPPPPPPGRGPVAPPFAPPPKPGADELDLPAPRGAAPKAPIAPPLDLDLPAPRAAAPKAPIAPPVDLDLDLPAPRGAAPKAPIAPPIDLDLPAPRGAAPKAPIAPPIDLDLPAPKGGKPAGLDDLDLPAPRGAAKPAAAPKLDELDLPAPRAAKGAAKPGLDDLDLPAPKGAKGGGGLEMDLPAPRGATDARPALADTSRTPFDDPDALDLPAPSRSGAAAELDLDLPSPKRGGGGGGLDLDLPAPKRDGQVLAAADRAFGDLDLPMPKRGGAPDIADLPAPLGGADLPAPRGAADLPAPRGAADLPAPRGAADLPAPRGASDLPTLRGDPAHAPRRGGSVELPPLPPAGGADIGLDLDLPPPRGAAPTAAPAASGGMGDLDLPPPRARGAAGEDAAGGLDDLSLPPRRARKASIAEFELPVPEQRGGAPRGHGEIDLPEGPRDDMEFADIPQERAAPPPSGLAIERPVTTQPKTVAKAPDTKPAAGRSRALVVTAGVVITIAAVGGLLTLTPYGPFGYYLVEQYLPGAGDASAIAQVIRQADEGALHDTPASYRQLLRSLATTRHDAGLHRGLLARSLLFEALYQVRFGSDPGGASRAAGIRQRIEQRDAEDPAVALGLAAEQLRLGNRTTAASLVSRARGFAANDPFVDIVDGWIAIAEDRIADAHEAFQAALEHGGGAAAQWGLARTLQRGEDLAAYDAAIEATLAVAPDHVDALYARATRLHTTGDDTQATTLAGQVVGLEPVGDHTLEAYPHVRAQAWDLLGEVYEARGRVSQALEAYEQAAQADSNDLGAVLGSGRMMLVDRPADALSRFEAVLQVEAAATTTMSDGRSAQFAARFGAAQAMTQLDRVQEAHATLDDLAAERPDDADVQLWLGRVEEQLDHDDAAEQHYRESVRLAPTVFDGYMALARLYDSLERTTDAVAVLESARSAVPESAQMRQDLGSYALSRSRLEEAEREFRRALELDAALPAARFGLGVTLRRAGRLDQAEAAFEALAEIDPGHPGLALERGQLFEARGQADRAVEYYRAALHESPEDRNLMLRLGGAEVAAGEYDAAEETLADVQRQGPPSAEAEHFIGRIAFARGQYPEAEQHFNRSISLDSTRGEFYMWSGWAALMDNDIGTALSQEDEALRRDASLGDAYYVRGVARVRSGMVRDALTDLTRAVELRPQRYEAYASMGDCYDQLRQLPQAITAYQRAVAAVDSNGEWWYKLGKLQLDASHTADSVHSLSRATLLGEAETPRPAWLADAHRILADGMRLSNERAGAIEHYRRYLAIAPDSAIDRDEVRSILMDMGVVPDP
jgi:tetratricopeptide (TPR) repeat protein